MQMNNNEVRTGDTDDEDKEQAGDWVQVWRQGFWDV